MCRRHDGEADCPGGGRGRSQEWTSASRVGQCLASAHQRFDRILLPHRTAHPLQATRWPPCELPACPRHSPRHTLIHIPAPRLLCHRPNDCYERLEAAHSVSLGNAPSPLSSSSVSACPLPLLFLTRARRNQVAVPTRQKLRRNAGYPAAPTRPCLCSLHKANPFRCIQGADGRAICLATCARTPGRHLHPLIRNTRLSLAVSSSYALSVKAKAMGSRREVGTERGCLPLPALSRYPGRHSKESRLRHRQ